MSRRSYASFASDKRMSKYRVTDDELFNLLSYLMIPKATTTTESKVSESKEHSSRLAALSNFSIGDMIKDLREGPNSKSVKFPDKLIKVLEQKLQDIAMGKDPAYSDQLVRRTMGKFYGQFMVDTFKRQMKENRKIEELILMFATHATGVLKKEPTLAGDSWKFELNNHIAIFVKLLRESLRGLNHVSPELLGRLDMYTAKLAPAQSNDSGYDSSSTSRDRDSTASLVISGNISDMALVKTVASLFKISESAVQKEVDSLRATCTEKTCLKNINANAHFPGRREDFESESAWQHWKTQETTQLQQMMVAMVSFNPELAKSTPIDVLPSVATSSSSSARPGSLYSQTQSSRQGSIGSRLSLHGLGGDFVDVTAPEDGDEDDIEVGHHFTYIPPNPKRFYKRLLELCLIADLEVMLSPEVDDNDEVSLGILSSTHIDLINECAIRWRIGHPYRASCFLDLVKQFYERNDVPLECIPEALQNVVRAMHDIELEKWPLQDVDYVCNIYGSLFNIFLSSLYHSMDAIPNLKPSEIEPYLTVLEHVRDSGFLDRFNVDVSARLADVQDRVRQVATESFTVKLRELQSAPGVNRALPLLLMTDEIEKSAKALDKRFPEPILGKIDVIPMFVAELQADQKRLFESSMNGPTPDVPIQDIFALYRRTKTLIAMLTAFAPETKIDFNLTGFFESYVLQWLINTDNKTASWVEAFQAEDAQGHSSSIVDLFDSLRSPINFLQDLEWDDEYQNARFFTALSKTVAKAVEHYCRSVETKFLAEMFPRPNDYIQPQKSSAWLEKARQLAIQGEKKVEPFNFQPESCVKLNNVEAARKLLDNMYNQMEADKLAEVLADSAPPVPEKVERERFLFSVKVVLAEGLTSSEASITNKLDTFVTLSDEAGTRLAKTRTIYETASPRWEETFDISVEKPLWLMVSVRDRALVGKHDTVGRAYLCLDPRRFGDLLTHDLWMDLRFKRMEGEKDDIQFYFGRAFRFLKRAESDMLRIFIDKVLHLLHPAIYSFFVFLGPLYKTLLKANSMGLDYNKALGNVTALYRSALGASSSELTDVEIEQAILPLFDYFDANLQTLNTYLSDTAKEKVMTRVWKEILTVIEADMKPLRDKEVDIVFKWLKGISLEVLQNQKYRDVFSIRLDELMEECVRMMQQSFRSSAGTIKKRAKSVYQQRNLGTIKERKEGEATGEGEFIAQQLQIMTQLQQEQEKRSKQIGSRKLSRPGNASRQLQKNEIPPLPPLPS
ncbi:hypothetical protein BT96DRAFT_955844 [Gymnopus androsaceus JB14]|uniref:Uncharacterized protein n=1 Tax=Gymnopus androsaceus JB14 TaxID=1447944 RepID=A0A6A4I4M2_9AGAR|nr:hypothetical protein BT96DRAFT_955844 [Gymnopus androsaceus JB14]